MLTQLQGGRLKLANRDFDTGQITRAGEYPLTDSTYAQLLSQLEQKRFGLVNPALRENILQFYASSGQQPKSQSGKDWQRTMRNLEELKAAIASNDQGNTSSSASAASAAH